MKCVLSGPALAGTLRKQRGFTLIELMVVFGVSILLSLTLVGIFAQSRASLDKASSRINLTQRARIPIDRAALFLTSAASANGSSGVEFPRATEAGLNTDDPSTWPQYCVFATTEDFSSNSYQPERDLAENGMGFYMFNSPPIYYYLIWYEGDSTKGDAHDVYPNVANSVLITKLNYPASLTEAYLLDPFANIDTSAAVSYRILGQQLNDCRFRRALDYGLLMRIETEGQLRRAVGSTEIETHVQTALIQLSSISLTNNFQ